MSNEVPDLAIFCANGHFTAATNQAELAEIQHVPPCFCGARHLRAVADWPVKNTKIVPFEPLRLEKVGVEQKEIEVFDVRKLFAPWHEPIWEINWDNLPPDILEAMMEIMEKF